MKSSRTDNTNIKSSICESLCILAEHKPKEKVTIAELIKKAGISRSSFYYYFENIDAVFYYMIDRFCEEYQEAGFSLQYQKIYGNAEELLKAEEVLCDIVLKNQRKVVFFLKDVNYFSFKERFFYNFQERCRTKLITAIYPNGETNALENRTAYEYSIYIYAGQMFSVLEFWVNRGFKESPKDFVSLHENTFTTLLKFGPDT